MPDPKGVADTASWARLSWAGAAQSMHDLPFPDSVTPRRDHYRLPRPAFVFGSGQRSDYASAADSGVSGVSGLGSNGYDLAIRRSGGGVVHLDPDTGLWIDLWVPADFADWASDLTRTFLHVGECWRRACLDVGLTAEVIQEGPTRDSPTAALARKVCYAGKGWGELLVDGTKVVGLSQRRTRWGARVQCLADFGPSRGLAGHAGRCTDAEIDQLTAMGLFHSVSTPDLTDLAAAFDRQL